MLLALPLATVLVCSETAWRETPARCAARIEKSGQWAYVGAMIKVFAADMRVAKPITMRLGSAYETGYLAWSYPTADGYGITLNKDWFARAPNNSLRIVAAHEVCHIAQGDVDRYQKREDVDRANAFDSPEHRRVNRCVIDLVGKPAYAEWLRDLQDFAHHRGRWSFRPSHAK